MSNKDRLNYISNHHRREMKVMRNTSTAMGDMEWN